MEASVLLQVQLAKYFGAEVTVVDSTEKLDMLRSIGADRVIDYTREEFTESDETYDAILDVVGKGSIPHCLRVLKSGGRYLVANPRLSSILRGLTSSKRGDKKVIFRAPNPTTEDLLFLKELIEAGRIRSVIDRRYPLEQVPEAHRYVESGHARGKVIIVVGQNGII